MNPIKRLWSSLIYYNKGFKSYINIIALLATAFFNYIIGIQKRKIQGREGVQQDQHFSKVFMVPQAYDLSDYGVGDPYEQNDICKVGVEC